MAKVVEIAEFVRLTRGGLSTETLAKAIRHRWPGVTHEELWEALHRSEELGQNQAATKQEG